MLEYGLFLQIREQIAAQSERLLRTAHGVARADFFTSLAEAAARYQYVRPRMTDAQTVSIAQAE